MTEHSESRPSFIDVIASLATGAAYGCGAAVLVMIAVFIFSSTSLSKQWFGGEGSAWLPVSIGVPASALAAPVAFAVFARKSYRKRTHGRITN